MTSEGNGQPIRYRVDYSGNLKQSIKDLHLQAAEQGNGRALVLVTLTAMSGRIKKMKPHGKESWRGRKLN
jgi:hypothetical protein